LWFAGTETPNLDKIDLYNDSAFEGKFLPSFLAEAEVVISRMPADKRRDDAIKLVEFFRAAKEYAGNVRIRFIGD
jgi:hypothetical protein